MLACQHPALLTACAAPRCRGAACRRLQRLLGAEGVALEFTPGAIREIAVLAERINKEVRTLDAGRALWQPACLSV